MSSFELTDFQDGKPVRPRSTTTMISSPLISQNRSSEEEALLSIILEVVPNLKKNVVIEIIRGNNYDLSASIDAALALSVSLSVEDGTPVTTKPASKSPRASLSPLQRTENAGADSQSAASEESPTKAYSKTRLPDLSSSDLGVSADDADNVATDRITIKRDPHDPKRGRPASIRARGAHVILPASFLAPPRFHVIIDRELDGALEFSIIFRRKKEKLGLSFQDIQGSIFIHCLYRKDVSDTSEPLLAMEAGLAVGDMLVGINGEYFSPGAEVQDVVDILHLCGDYVTLNLARGLGGSIFGPPHRHATILVDQGVITEDVVGVVSKSLRYLKSRMLSWDSGWISRRISKWQLDRVSASPASVFPLMLTSVAFHSTSLPMGNMNWKAPDILSDSSVTARATDTVVHTRGLRPALSVRIMKAEERRDHVVYVIWVMDVLSGAQWVVSRRFREFSEFRDMAASIRPAIARVEFPPKRINAAETNTMVIERQIVLQKFLRKVSSMVCSNSLHPSSVRLQLVLQQFIAVEDRQESIEMLERSTALPLRNIVQAFVHGVLQMGVMDKVLNGYIDNFMDTWEEDPDRVLDRPSALALLENMREFIDNLQSVLCDGLMADCVDIIEALSPLTSSASSLTLSQALAKAKARCNDSSEGLSSFYRCRREDDDSQHGVPEALESKDSMEEAASTCNAAAALSSSSQSEEEMRLIARAAIRRQVEIEIYVPCAIRLRHALEVAFAGNESDLSQRILSIRSKPQSFYGIPEEHVSPSGWEDVVFAFKGIRKSTLPHDRLETLIEAAKSIPKVFSSEHPEAHKPLGADEFLPLFIFVVVQAQIPNLLALNVELQHLCDSEKRMSEAGYYVATLEASIQHLLDGDYSPEASVFSFANRPTSASDCDKEEEEDEETDENEDSNDDVSYSLASDVEVDLSRLAILDGSFSSEHRGSDSFSRDVLLARPILEMSSSDATGEVEVEVEETKSEAGRGCEREGEGGEQEGEEGQGPGGEGEGSDDDSDGDVLEWQAWLDKDGD